MTSWRCIAKLFSRIAFLAAVLSVTLWVPAANADPITWTLHNVTFNDGGTAVGSFTFDADEEYQPFPPVGLDITTTGGSDFSGYNSNDSVSFGGQGPESIGIRLSVQRRVPTCFDNEP
jgi:hypothetical protein